jgi:hypothetical protein
VTARSFASCLFLLLATLSVVEITLDSASYHVSVRQQWRARGPHHNPARASQKKMAGLGVEPAGLLALLAFGHIAPADAVASLPLVSASVFVPPRV